MHLVRMGELLSLLSDLHTRIHNAATIALARRGHEAACDLLVTSPKENDGILVLGLCPLCGSEEWRRVG